MKNLLPAQPFKPFGMFVGPCPLITGLSLLKYSFFSLVLLQSTVRLFIQKIDFQQNMTFVGRFFAIYNRTC
jgi:hypothetical protein